MTSNDILEALCSWDIRNPYFVVTDYSNEEIKEHEKRIKSNGCSCHNCFYGRSELANELLKRRG